VRNACRFLVVALVVVVLAGFGWLMVKPSAPTYQGKTLDQWLEIVGKTFHRQDDVIALEAIRHFGTNAIPTLIANLETKNSPIRDRAAQWLYGHPGIPIKILSPIDKRYRGYLGFCALGPDGSPAIPQLIRLLNDPDAADNSRDFAIRSLDAMGPVAASAIPDLVTCLNGTSLSGGNQYGVFELLGHIHGRPELVVPVLIKALTNSETGLGTRGIVIADLGQYGTNARAAAPYLPPYLTNFLDWVRVATTNTLEQIGIAAVPATAK
jgi:hypothetical protein